MRRIIVILAVLIAGCSGELERPVENPVELKEQKRESMPIQENDYSADFIIDSFIENDLAARIDDSFKFEGEYGTEECQCLIYSKEFEKTYLFIFVDCHNNYVQQIIRK